MSGRPGKSLRCSRNLYPSPWINRRRAISGLVSLLRIRRIFALRRSVLILSIAVHCAARLITGNSGPWPNWASGTLADLREAARNEASSDLTGNSVSHWRRECVADLPVGVGSHSRNLPAVRKTLKPGHHFDGENRHPNKITLGGIICNEVAIDAKVGPGLLGPRRTEIGTAMLFGPSDDRRGDCASLAPPCFRTSPLSSRH